jgi:aminopeptidase N
VNLTIDLSDGDLAFLMGHDPDLYNRWQASQDYAMRLLVEATEAKRAGKSPPSPAAFIAALKRSAFDEALEPAYRAQMLALPGQGDIARVIAREVDPAAVYAATRWLGRQIGVAIGQDLVRLYTANASQTPYSPDAEQSGRRALRNRALGLLFLRGQPSDLDRTLRHFERARNATDETLGLALLATIDGPARAVALERFYGRWKADHLMIDHWFAVQAMAPQESTLSIVQTLTGHRLFSLTNPNKVRSLLFTFASANPVNFNRPDGAGYAFIAEQVRQLDRINPQMAARLAGSFRNWRVMEADRRRQAEKTLRALARTPRLSRDVYEIVSKTLD